MEHRDERIVVETSRYRITGTLRMPRDGYRSRLTDYLNAAERAFVALTEVEIEALDAATVTEHRAFVAVSLSQIVLAMPADASDSVSQAGAVDAHAAGVGEAGAAGVGEAGAAAGGQSATG